MLIKKTLQITTVALLSLASLMVHAVEVSDAWIREAPPAAQMMGGFMTISNTSDKDEVLVGASSAIFMHIMLHRTVEKDGVSKMMHQDEVVIPAHNKVEFKPGDYHIMMPTPEKRLVVGDKVMVKLEFKSGKTVDVEYTVRKGMAMMRHGDGMKNMPKH